MTLLKKIPLLALAAMTACAPVFAMTGELLSEHQAAEQFGQLNADLEANLHLQAVQDWIRETNNTTTIVPLLLRTLERQIAHEKSAPQALTSVVMEEILTHVVRVLFLAYVDEVAQEVHMGDYRPGTADYRISTLLSSYLRDQLALLTKNPASGYPTLSSIISRAQPFFVADTLSALATPTWVQETAGGYSMGFGWYVNGFTFGNCKEADKNLYANEAMQAALLVTRLATVDALLLYFGTLNWDTFLLNYKANQAALQTRAETLATIVTTLREAHEQTDGTTSVSFEMPAEEDEEEEEEGGESSGAPVPTLSPRQQLSPRPQSPTPAPAPLSSSRDTSPSRNGSASSTALPTSTDVNGTANALTQLSLDDAPPGTPLTDSMEAQGSPRRAGVLSAALDREEEHRKPSAKKERADGEEEDTGAAADDSDVDMELEGVEEDDEKSAQHHHLSPALPPATTVTVAAPITQPEQTFPVLQALENTASSSNGNSGSSRGHRRSTTSAGSASIKPSGSATPGAKATPRK